MTDADVVDAAEVTGAARGNDVVDAAELTMTTLLCDADGNLFPSEEPAFAAGTEVTNAFLTSFGVPQRYSAEELRRAAPGQAFRSTTLDLAVRHGIPLEPALAAGRPGYVGGRGSRVLTALELEQWVAKELSEVTRHLGDVLRPDPEVLEPLRRLAGCYRLAVVSSSAHARLAACFRATGLDGLLPEVVRFSGEDSLAVPTSKPDPAIYLHACEALGIAPREALAVEDSAVGARAAVAAGIPTVGNVQFVPVAEREERTRLLYEVGVVAVVGSWAELEQRLPADGRGRRIA